MSPETLASLRGRLRYFSGDTSNVILANEYGAISWLPIDVALESPTANGRDVMGAAMNWFFQFAEAWDRGLPNVPSFEPGVLSRTLLVAGNWRHFPATEDFKTVYHGDSSWHESRFDERHGVPTGEQIMLAPVAKPLSVSLAPKLSNETDFTSRVFGLRAQSEKEYPDAVLLAWPSLELGAFLREPGERGVDHPVVTRLSVTGRINVSVFCMTRLHEPSLMGLQAQNALNQHVYPLTQALNSLGKRFRGLAFATGQVEVPPPQHLQFGQFRL